MIYPETHPMPDPFGLELVGDAHHNIAPTVEVQQWDVPSEAVRIGDWI